MANINRDYIVVVDVKKSSISLANGTMIFNTLDKNTSNIFVNLVINTSSNTLINKYANIENAEDYTVSMNIVKPNNECLILEARLHDKDLALFEIELPAGATDVVGNYRCELLTKCTIKGRQEVTTSNVVNYIVQPSVFTDVSSEVLESEKYPIVMEMFDKLSNIDRYEEDRRQAEIVRQVNERNREQYFDAMTGGMQDEFNDLMEVMTEQVERIEERYANTDFGIFHARFEAVEEVNRIQDERLNAKDVTDKYQDYNIACLFADSNTQRATIEIEGNSTPLLNSKDGFALVHDIEGKTMVNLNKDTDKSLTLNGAIDLEGDDIITTQGVDGGLVDVYLEGNTMVNVCDQEDEVSLPANLEMRYLYTSTEYTIQFTSDTATTTDITLGGTTLSNQNVVVGLNKITITTSSTLVDNKLKIDGIGCNISNIVVTEATDKDFGYFKGMKSVGECEDNKIEILSRNKNILDINKLENGYIVLNGINIGNPMPGNMDYKYTDLIKVMPNQYIYLSTNSPYTNIQLFQYDNTKKYVKNSGAAFNMPILISNNVHYIRFYASNNLWDNGTYYQIEFNNVKSSYVPHSSNKTEISLSEPLRSLPNGVCDRIVKIDGQWYIERNCAEVTLNGTETDWYIWNVSSTPTNTIAFAMPTNEINGVNEADNSSSVFDNTICDKFIESNETIDSEWHMTHSDIVANNRWWAICINKTKLTTIDVTGFKQWLSNNPTTVVYQLATPTYEPIEYNSLEVYTDMTHITTNSTIPANLKVKNHGFNALLKPNTTYTIASSQGVQTFITGAEIDDCLRLYGTGTMKDVRVLEGAITDTDLIPAHFSGIESAFEQHYDEEVGKYKVEVKTTGKNLFNIELWKDITLHNGTHSIEDNNIIITATDSDCYTNTGMESTGNVIRADRRHLLVPVKPNTTYTISYTKTAGGQSNYYCLIDSGYYATYYDILSRTPGDEAGTSVTTITTDNNTKYIGIRLGVMVQGRTITYSNLQIEEGITATTYEPYKSSTISFYLDEPLRGIGNVRDSATVQDGKVKVTRRYGKVVLDGSEDWRQTTVTGWNKQIYEMINSTLDIKANESSTAIPNIVSDILLAVDMNKLVNHDVYGITVWRLSTTEPSFFIDVESVTNVDGLKQWLSNNPITVVYELATPTVEEIDGVGGRLAVEIYENGHLSFNTNIPVSSELEYTVSVPVLENVAEVASITDEQDMLIVDMATQLAIMNLTL